MSVLKCLLEIDGTDTLPTNVHPCTFVDDEFLLRKNVAAAYTPPPSVAVLKCLLEIDDADARSI